MFNNHFVANLLLNVPGKNKDSQYFDNINYEQEYRALFFDSRCSFG